MGAVKIQRPMNGWPIDEQDATDIPLVSFLLYDISASTLFEMFVIYSSTFESYLIPMKKQKHKVDLQTLQTLVRKENTVR